MTPSSGAQSEISCRLADGDVGSSRTPRCGTPGIYRTLISESILQFEDGDEARLERILIKSLGAPLTVTRPTLRVSDSTTCKQKHGTCSG